jgi:hypothetical protein
MPEMDRSQTPGRRHAIPERSVLVPDQIGGILGTYSDVLQTEPFLGLTLVPKTLKGRSLKKITCEND